MMIKEYDALHKQEKQTEKKRELFYYGLLEYLKKNLLDVIQKYYILDFKLTEEYRIDLMYERNKEIAIRKNGKNIIHIKEISEKNNVYHKDSPFLFIRDEDIILVKEFADQLPSLLNETLQKKYEDEKYKADEKEALYEMLYRQPI